MVIISKNVLLPMLLIIFVALQLKEGNSQWFLPPIVTVYVTNNMTNYRLTVHCKDKHHDIGFQTLQYGQSYTFHFRPNAFRLVSLYFCSFSWINEFHRFDIYVQKRDQDNCQKECHWAINESGPCKVIDDYINCFPWNSYSGLERRQFGHAINM